MGIRFFGARAAAPREVDLFRAVAVAALVAAALVVSPQVASAQFVQQGGKLTASGIASQGASVTVSADGNTATAAAYYAGVQQLGALVYLRDGNGTWTQSSQLIGSGMANCISAQALSVALSADGNTAIVGAVGICSIGGEGAWVFVRDSNGNWTQQGGRLFGSGASGDAQQGYSVALSADGNTAIVGGSGDNSNVGAAWVYTRSNGVWTQQGSKLIGSGSSGTPKQGWSVALSADGNTAIVGGLLDNTIPSAQLGVTGDGAAWVFTRDSNGTWTQQGSKLVGSGASGQAQQGASVALSADGNTAIVGGPQDHAEVGAAWIYTRSNGTWTQQGSKVVGSGVSGIAAQGTSAALSADGNTAIVGGPEDNAEVGAAWVYTRSNGTWTQQNSKLVGSGASGAAKQDTSVALSGDGNTAVVGGPGDSSG
ncbi:MAG: hypothetical protein WBD48_16950, partial [Pseudolabrys sp.]